jgi:hypothetical protein
MKNVTELRNDLMDVYKQTKENTTDNQTAGILANIAGKIIKSAAVELSYNQFKKYTQKKIEFLEG